MSSPFSSAALAPRLSRVGLPVVLVALLALAGSAVSASAAARPAAQVAAVRHTPDAPTQQTMERLRDLLAQQRPAVEQQKLTGTDYRTLADQVDGLLNELAQSAGPQPGAPRKAFLSIVERDLRWAIDTMRRSSKVDVQRSGALAMFQALRNYGVFFDHPGWAWP
jgi:hypothetical protein